MRMDGVLNGEHKLAELVGDRAHGIIEFRMHDDGLV